jgi:hypothetical protein
MRWKVTRVYKHVGTDIEEVEADVIDVVAGALVFVRGKMVADAVVVKAIAPSAWVQCVLVEDGKEET